MGRNFKLSPFVRIFDKGDGCILFHRTYLSIYSCDKELKKLLKCFEKSQAICPDNLGKSVMA